LFVSASEFEVAGCRSPVASSDRSKFRELGKFTSSDFLALLSLARYESATGNRQPVTGNRLATLPNFLIHYPVINIIFAPMIYPIVMYGDPILRQRAKDIKPGTDIKQLVADMYETMHNASGIGLAAPQIGKSVRLFIVDGTSLDEEPGMENFKKVFVNPEIVKEHGTAWEFEEGCLSIPNIREKISRKEKLKLRYFDENWNAFEEEYEGMKARIIQHEYDHIEGKLFVDYLTPLKKRMLKGKLADISKGKVDTEYRILAPLKK
jgi:peptide deformylase